MNLKKTHLPTHLIKNSLINYTKSLWTEIFLLHLKRDEISMPLMEKYDLVKIKI